MMGMLKTFMLVLLLCTMSVAVAGADNLRDLSFDLGGGYRSDRLDWNIAGSNGYPNVLSELEWDDLDIYQLSLASTLIVENGRIPFGTYLRMSATYGWVVDGQVQDSDYAGDDRSAEFSRSYAAADGGDVLDLNIGLGVQFDFFKKHLLVTPLIGYAYSEQNLVMKDGFQAVSDNFQVPAVGTYFPELDSSYDTQWRTAWAGLDVCWLIGQRLKLDGSIECHAGDFEAEADWNLRDTMAHPLSFEHEADAQGVVVDLAIHYLLTDSWALNAGMGYRRFETDAGVDTIYASDGGVSRVRLNEVNLESFSATLGVRYDFF